MLKNHICFLPDSSEHRFLRIDGRFFDIYYFLYRSDLKHVLNSSRSVPVTKILSKKLLKLKLDYDT